MLISGGNLIFPRLPMLAAMAILCLASRNWVIDFKRNMLPIWLLLSAVLMLTLLRPSGVDLLSTAIRYANFFGGILLLDVYLNAGGQALSRDLFAIGKFMTWQALITMVLAVFFNFLFLPIEVSDTLYFTVFGIFNYHVMVDDSTLRPDGIFYEPGVFQIYLNLFLYLALFIFRSWRWSLLGLLAVLATRSTTGVAIGLIIVFWFVATRYINSGSLPLRIAKVFGAGIFVAAIGAVAVVNVTEKVSGDSQGSFWARQYDLITGLNIIEEHPLAGIGFDYEQYYRASADLGYADTELPDRIIQDRGNSNGIVSLLYSVGIPLGIVFLIGMFRQTFFPERILVGIVLFIACLGESLVFSPFFLMFMFNGLLTRSRAPGGAAVPAHG
jgi:hypothetical protein